MESTLNKITINGVTYVAESDQEQVSNQMKYVIVRTYSAGVFAGYLESRSGREVVLRKARRLWQFYSASLSQLAQSGTPDASKCKFPEEVDRVELLEAIEILDVTPIAKKSIDGVPVWKVS